MFSNFTIPQAPISLLCSIYRHTNNKVDHRSPRRLEAPCDSNLPLDGVKELRSDRIGR